MTPEQRALYDKGRSAFAVCAACHQDEGQGMKGLAPALAVEGAAAARLERVAAGGGAVVMTGQQPGLFGGPVYLEIWVKVKSGWADNEAGLRAYGYE